jgi:hypothetical protein
LRAATPAAAQIALMTIRARDQPGEDEHRVGQAVAEAFDAV